MVDSVSVKTHNSYGSRIKKSLWNILWWFVLVIISIILLIWNEKNFIKTKKSLEEWAAVVVEASAWQIDSSLNGKEVHVYWETASSSEQLKDEIFWVITDDLKLARTVEMYQWHEDRHESCTDNYWWSEDCETIYDYKTSWDENHINSSSFHQSTNHTNPSVWTYESDEWEKSPITLWTYTLDRVFIDQLTNYVSINLNEQNVINPYDSKFHINWNHIYIWDNENSPKVWDLRITFYSVKTWTVSIIWQQFNNHLMSYPTSVEWKSIALLKEWIATAEVMFAEAQDANKSMTWIFRLVWLVLMFLGFTMLLEFIETLAKVLPFLANIIGVWTSIIAFCLTLIVWFVTIGIAWIAVRPVIWISCLIVAIAWIVLLNKKKKKSKDTPNEENIIKIE